MLGPEHSPALPGLPAAAWNLCSALLQVLGMIINISTNPKPLSLPCRAQLRQQRFHSSSHPRPSSKLKMLQERVSQSKKLCTAVETKMALKHQTCCAWKGFFFQ